MGRTSDTKENLINSAIELIGNRSYNAVGVQELCEHAGVKNGSFYHFFPSKRDLTLEALDLIWKKFKEETLDPVFNSDASALEKSLRWIHAHSATYVALKRAISVLGGLNYIQDGRDTRSEETNRYMFADRSNYTLSDMTGIFGKS